MNPQLRCMHGTTAPITLEERNDGEIWYIQVETLDCEVCAAQVQLGPGYTRFSIEPDSQ